MGKCFVCGNYLTVRDATIGECESTYAECPNGCYSRVMECDSVEYIFKHAKLCYMNCDKKVMLIKSEVNAIAEIEKGYDY